MSPWWKSRFTCEAGTLSVLEGIGNNHENKQRVVYAAHGKWGRRRPLSPEKSSFLQSPGLGVRLGEGGCPPGEAVEGADGEGGGGRRWVLAAGLPASLQVEGGRG